MSAEPGAAARASGRPGGTCDGFYSHSPPGGRDGCWSDGGRQGLTPRAGTTADGRPVTRQWTWDSVGEQAGAIGGTGVGRDHTPSGKGKPLLCEPGLWIFTSQNPEFCHRDSWILDVANKLKSKRPRGLCQ